MFIFQSGWYWTDLTLGNIADHVYITHTTMFYINAYTFKIKILDNNQEFILIFYTHLMHIDLI